jgi:Fur family transcriptional regulator, iron response regulator
MLQAQKAKPACSQMAALQPRRGCCYMTAMVTADHIEERLRDAGLRPTQQRVALARLLFGKGDRHLCAEDLHAEALAADVPVSLATIYNTLNQFTSAGLLRELAIEGDRSYFDTNTSNHFHFFDSENQELMDIDADKVSVVGMPPLPKGKVIDRVDVIVRLKDCGSR